jgi:hypothetical protein
VSRDTVADFDAGIRHPNETNLAATALEKAVVAFLEEDGCAGSG